MPDKVLLVFADHDRREISILIPKRRGTGYAMVPLGHHACTLSTLAYDIGFDLYGLDGSLDVQTGFIGERRDALLGQIMPLLSRHYGMEWRVVDQDEYLINHPIKSVTAGG